MAEARERWGGRTAFIMAAVGSAVGLGNVWRFPYTAFRNGGGAFLIPYFVALLTAGIPIMIVEYALGQRFQRGAPDALARVKPWFRWVGWFAIMVGLTITFYYVVIMAASWIYLVASPGVGWTRPAPVARVDKARPGWVEVVPPERVIVYHRFQTERERERLEAIEASKPEARRLGIYMDEEVEVLREAQERYPESERKLYVPLDENIANFFTETGLGGFRPAVWATKARHNAALRLAREIRDSAVGEPFPQGLNAWPEGERVEGFVRASQEENLHRELRRRIAAWNETYDDFTPDVEAALAGLVEGDPAQERPYLADMMRPSGSLVLWSGVTWLAIFVVIASGVRNVGRIVMVTVPLPIVILLVILVRGVTLSGAADGIEFYLTPDWSRLGDPSVWIAAYGQVFFSLTLGFGTLIAYASYMPDDSDISNNAFITSFANCATSFFAGFAVFSVLGYLAYIKGGIPVDEVAQAGPGLAFIAYPMALAQLPGFWAPLTSVLFFACLLFLGIDSAFSLVEGMLTGLSDRIRRNKVALTGAICLVGFLASCVFSTRSGLMWLDIVDNWMNNYGLVLVGLLQCIAVGYFANFSEFRRYVNRRSEIHLDTWFDLFVKVVTPSVLIYLLATQFGRDIARAYGGYDAIVPWSVNVAGWGWSFLLILIALLLSRDWIAFSWVALGLVAFNILRLGLDRSASTMGTLGFVLLFGGLGTCLMVALRHKEEKGGAVEE